MSTSLALGAVGAVAGFFIGGPVGAAWGWSLGALAGNLLDPQKIEGPRNSDLKIQGSQYGGMIPIVYGKVRIVGNVIWGTDKVEHQHKSGGKGGPQTTTYTYTQSWATRLCEGPDKIVLRAWANGRLVYDPDNNVTEMTFTQYPGSETQLPDPTIEAHEGAGTVPGYRGVCYVVHADQDLTNYGMMIPNMSYEVSGGTIIDCPVTTTYSGSCVPTSPDTKWHEGTSGGTGPYPAIEQWIDPAGTPDLVTKLPNTVFVHTSPGGGGPSWGFEYFTGPKYSVHVGEVLKTHPTWMSMTLPTSTNLYNPSLAWGTKMFVTLPGSGDVHQFNGTAGTRKAWIMAEGATYPADRDDGGTTPLLTTVPIPALGLDLIGTCGIPANLYVQFLVGTPDTLRLFVFTGSVAFTGTATADEWWELIDGKVSRHGTCDPPLNQNDFGLTNHTQPQYLSFACSMAENNGQYVWSYVSTGVVGGSLRCYKIDSDNNLAQICTDKHLAASGSFAAPSMWTFEGGLCGVVANISFEVFRRYTVGNFESVTYGAVVSDVSERVGLVTASQIDVSQLTEVIDGYTVASRMPGRSIIEALMPCGFFDATESDGRVKFPKRGGDSVKTIDVDDLGAFSYGGQPPASVQRTRGIDTSLPSQVDVVYPNTGADYQNGTQSSPRQVGDSRSPVTIQTAIAMSDAKAKQVADANLFSVWYERDRAVISLPPKYLALEPGDVITLSGRRERIAAKHESMSGPAQFDLVADLAELWTQAAVASAGGSSSTPPAATAPQTTDLLLLDIPYIVDPTQQQKYFAAMAGSDRQAWLGATLFKSINDGASYDALVSDSGPADTFGVTDGVLGDWTDGYVFDERNSVTIVLTAGAGELAGVGRTGALNGQGQFLIGDEIVAAKNCVLTDTRTYVLSGLLRGLNGTGWATGTHVDGERVVALPLTTSIDALWAEYGLERKYQAVTSGQPLPTGGGSSGGGGTGFAATHIIDLGVWGHHVAYTSNNGGFGPNDLVAVKFTTGTGPSLTNNMPRIAGAEYQGGAADRVFSLSDTLGNFDGIIDSALGTTYFAAKGTSSAPTVPFTVNNTANQVYFPILKPNTVYYLNLKMAPTAGTTGDAPMYFELSDNGAP